MANTILERGSQNGTGREIRWKAWMIETQLGNEKSYALLLHELSRTAVAYAQYRIQDRGDAEDFSQDVLVSVHKARHTFRHDRLFTPWFFTIVRNRFIDLIRKQKRQIKTQGADEIDGFIDNPGREMDLTVIDSVRDAIARLPEKHRMLLQLQLEGYSLTEIAAKFRMKVNAAKVATHRARIALKTLLRRDYEFD